MEKWLQGIWKLSKAIEKLKFGKDLGQGGEWVVGCEGGKETKEKDKPKLQAV